MQAGSLVFSARPHTLCGGGGVPCVPVEWLPLQQEGIAALRAIMPVPHNQGTYLGRGSLHMMKVVPTAAGGMVCHACVGLGVWCRACCACLWMRSVGPCIGLVASARRVPCEPRPVCGVVVVCLVEVYSSCVSATPQQAVLQQSTGWRA
jgi:hypothetical protein